MMKADGESWNAVDNVGTDERTPSGRLDWVQFTADLDYTRKASRKRGLGSFLAAATIGPGIFLSSSLAGFGCARFPQ
jgi:hypothetical protein